MNLRSLLLAIFLFLLSFQSHGQSDNKVAIVKGKLLHAVTEKPVPNLPVRISYLKQLTSSNEAGEFIFRDIPFGTHAIYLEGEEVASDTIRFIANSELVHLGAIKVRNYHAPLPSNDVVFPVVTIDENSFDQADGVMPEAVSGVLGVGRDPFLNIASFTWSGYGFKKRGNRQDHQELSINGVPMNDAASDRLYWGQIGGLNDVFKTKTSSYGLEQFDYGFGGSVGAVYLDATAASQRRQTRFTYSLSNRLYTHRIMLTHNSGPQKAGWAYSFSLSSRWANEGYVPGTFYDSRSFYAALSKTVSSVHKINLTTFGASSSRGRSSRTYQEAYELAGSSYYNPEWGFQNGRKRNAAVSYSFRPVILLNYEYAPSQSTHWNTAVSYQSGKTTSTSLDWYNAPDPRPDYYRYLPGFYLLSDPPDSLRAGAYAAAFAEYPQIDWDAMYQANYANRLPPANGTGDSLRRSLYVLGNDVEDIRKWTVSSYLQKALNDHVNLLAGFSYIRQDSRNYRELLDLLGGDYFLNINSFAERVGSATNATTFIQYDLNQPDRMVREGDQYGYSYLIHVRKVSGWAQLAHSSRRWDYFMAVQGGSTSYEREGLYRNGLYSSGNGSFGRSGKQSFTNYGFKGGATFKINARNYLFLNAGHNSDAPPVDNIFFSARVRNTTVSDLMNQTNYLMEAGYYYRSPKTNVRVVGYSNDTRDQTIIQRFYYQGTGSANTFVNYVMQHLNTRSIGAELGFTQQLISSFTLTAAGALGQSFYTNNPDVMIYQENTPNTTALSESVYLKNAYVGVGPQSAYSLAINYRSKKYWYCTLTGNYLDRNYINIAAPRRSEQAVELVSPGSPRWHAILDQEQLAAAYTLDIFFGGSLLLSRFVKKLPPNVFFYLNVGVNNLLDNRNIKVSGYENPRFDYSGGYANKFAPTYSYAFGRNFFLNLSVKY